MILQMMVMMYSFADLNVRIKFTNHSESMKSHSESMKYTMGGGSILE